MQTFSILKIGLSSSIADAWERNLFCWDRHHLEWSLGWSCSHSMRSIKHYNTRNLRLLIQLKFYIEQRQRGDHIWWLNCIASPLGPIEINFCDSYTTHTQGSNCKSERKLRKRCKLIVVADELTYVTPEYRKQEQMSAHFLDPIVHMCMRLHFMLIKPSWGEVNNHLFHPNIGKVGDEHTKLLLRSDFYCHVFALCAQ